ncbi:T-cell antigen CD7 [Protopterus annectens]|uniref:T-cell antigen CD7 n=1 Tax=Protopterus annectens TaxID=7888 RepID=UPI001CFB34D6|nr:T-cell antigen CD7 [Protopterus annectens]
MKTRVLFIIIGHFHLLPSLLSGTTVTQSETFIHVQEGETISITCAVHLINSTLTGMYLKKNWKTFDKIFHISNTMDFVVDQKYQDRITHNGPLKELIITLRQLFRNDSGIYFCEAVIKTDSRPLTVFGSGTLIYVSDKTKTSACEIHPEVTSNDTTVETPENSSLMPKVLFVAIAVLTLVCIIFLFVLYKSTMKKCCHYNQSHRVVTSNTEYEDMTFRRSTVQSF